MEKIHANILALDTSWTTEKESPVFVVDCAGAHYHVADVHLLFWHAVGAAVEMETDIESKTIGHTWD